MTIGGASEREVGGGGGGGWVLRSLSMEWQHSVELLSFRRQCAGLRERNSEVSVQESTETMKEFEAL
ncbi:hypothetical protein BaRGS_00027558 [Batillaria attramentaria]|uniref:Uncharacterized protein n=1 Tax=Batillaria attramentaria TaxID=370345 RepID=A0ABD0K2U4_9CAEN